MPTPFHIFKNLPKVLAKPLIRHRNKGLFFIATAKQILEYYVKIGMFVYDAVTFIFVKIQK